MQFWSSLYGNDTMVLGKVQRRFTKRHKKQQVLESEVKKNKVGKASRVGGNGHFRLGPQ